MSEDTPAPAEHGGTGGGGGFLSTTKGIVAGVTSLVVAVTGLLVACEKLAPGEPGAKVETVASTGDAAGPAGDDAAAETPDDTLPSLYTGEDTRLEWDEQEDHWVLTIGEDVGTYEEVTSDREEDAMARLIEGNAYLRWPLGGGWLEFSDDGKASWSRLARVTPTEPERPQADADPAAAAE